MTSVPPQSTQFWQLSPAVNLRAERFGGMAFHRWRGITLEVDAEAYRFLRAYSEPLPLPRAGHPAARLVPQLARMGFLCPAVSAATATGPERETVSALPRQAWSQPGEWADGYTLSAPETVHIAITRRCNQACPGCYVPRPRGDSELSVSDWRALIDQWAQMRVFQLAVGGGEPLLYEGLLDVLRYAGQRGIVPNLTTNGALLDAATVRELESAGVARVNLSWNGPVDDTREPALAFGRALPLLLDSKLQVGVNLMITSWLVRCLPDRLAQLWAQGVRKVTILRPKPPAFVAGAGKAWYDAQRLRRADLLTLRDILNTWREVLGLEVDCSLVGLMGDSAPAHLSWRGVHGCAAGRRICTVWPDGQVTPCSFLADLCAGSVRQTSFAELWAKGSGWEALRDPSARPQGDCAGCTLAAQCGGARCVARYKSGHKASELCAGDSSCLGLV